MSDLYRNIRNIRISRGITQEALAEKMGYKSKSTIAKIESGINDIPQSKIKAFADALSVTVGDLMGIDSPDGLSAPTTTDNVVSFPVIGDMAAGFEHIAAENWSGDTICVPESYLHGRPASDYIVLNV